MLSVICDVLDSAATPPAAKRPASAPPKSDGDYCGQRHGAGNRRRNRGGDAGARGRDRKVRWRLDGLQGRCARTSHGPGIRSGTRRCAFCIIRSDRRRSEPAILEFDDPFPVDTGGARACTYTPRGRSKGALFLAFLRNGDGERKGLPCYPGGESPVRACARMPAPLAS